MHKIELLNRKPRKNETCYSVNLKGKKWVLIIQDAIKMRDYMNVLDFSDEKPHSFVIDNLELTREECRALRDELNDLPLPQIVVSAKDRIKDRLGTYTMGNVFHSFRHQRIYPVHIAGKKYKFAILDVLRMRNSFNSMQFEIHQALNPELDLYLDFIFNNKKKIQLSMTECLALQKQLNEMQLPLVQVEFPDKTVFLK